MSWWQPVTPSWVHPSTFAVHDAHVLAYKTFTDTRTASAAGMVTALSWVRGGRDAPVTGRNTQPVTREIATFEQWAAVAVRDDPANATGSGPALPAPPLEGMAQTLRVPFLPPRPVGRQWAEGVRRVLRWLEAEIGAPAPVSIPLRHPDGRPLSGAEIREQHIVAEPGLWSDPETRWQVEARAVTAAQRNQELLALLGTVTAQFGTPAPAPRQGEQRYTYRPASHR